MFLSKAQLVRIAVIAIIVLFSWTVWKRLDAVIDTYKQYYDLALGVNIIQNMWDRESEEFNKGWDSFAKDFSREWNSFSLDSGFAGRTEKEDGDKKGQTDNRDREMEKQWQEYERKAPLKPYNKPVPMVADEWAKGFYTGFWNFFITSGLASIFAIVIVIFGSGFLIRLVFMKLSDEKINNALKKAGLG